MGHRGPGKDAMVFLRSSAESDARPSIRAASVLLRLPTLADYHAWAELRGASRNHLTPWEPTWSQDELSRASFKLRLRHYERELKEGTGYSFLVFRLVDGALVGGMTLTNIRRGVTQTGTVGYWVGHAFAGQGKTTEALGSLCGFAFDGLGLHRLEAACLVRNAASIRVLEKCGFRQEGLARRYLKINGAWQDHLLYARLSDDPEPPVATGASASSMR